MNRLILLVESRIRGDVYVRFGGELPKTHRSNTAGRWMLSLPRHVCYAYMLGHERKDFRANDNGEPSGTAGKPILGQINSNELTDILIIVVRYFGGIKLGTSGLIVAYKAAAAEAIAAADIVERTVDEEITVSFEYPFMNDIMRIVKEDEPAILEQSYDMDCLMRLRIRKSMMGKLRARLEKVETARIIE